MRSIKLPLKISRQPAAYYIRDSAGVLVGCVYFEDEASRRDLVRLPTRQTALEIAQATARALTERLSGAQG